MLPAPKLDDKRFAELVEEAKALIPVYASEWTDYNIHDPGITFTELFAWLIEMQIYRLDQVTERNKLKFLKLLGIKPRYATSAKVDVTFSLPNEYTECVLVRKGTKVAAKDVEETGENIVFETDREIHVVPVKLECVVSKFWTEIRDNTKANELDGHFYHAFGEKAEKGSMLYLGFNNPLPHDEIDLMVYLYEGDLIEMGKHGEEEPEITPSAEVSWEYSREENSRCKWTELEIVRDETLELLCSGMISFRAPKDMAKCKVPPFEKDELYWIRCKVEKAGYEIPPRIDAIQLNTVPVTQGETVKDEEISSTGRPNQSFSLQHKPVLAGSQVISVQNINKLSADVAEGANSLEVNSIPRLQKDDELKIEDGTLTNVEYQKISGFVIMVQKKMRFAHSAAAVEIKKVREEESLFIYKLSLDAAEGANSLRLNNVQGLEKDDTLRINDPDGIEYVIIKSVSDSDKTVTLTSKLLYTHNANTSIEKVKMKEISLPVAYKLSDDIEEGADSLLMDKVPALQEYDILKIKDSNEDKVEYHVISGITIKVQKMRFAHCATTPTKKKVIVEEVSSVQDKTWMDWKGVDDFDASGPEDPHYVIDHDTGEVTFGDGVHGLIPPEGKDNIRATYRFGGDERGNIKTEAIDLVLEGELKDLKVTVTNKLPASGGARKEKLEEAIIRARKDLKKPYRAVTSKDYENIAKATPGLRVKRAKAISDKHKGSVTVIVIPESTSDKSEDKPEPSDGFRMTVCKHLDKHRLITTEVQVKGAEYVKVSVNAVVKIKRGYKSEKVVRDRIENALKQFLHPLKGGPEKKGWPFGRSVFKSEIYELIDGIEGVDYVQESLNMIAQGYRYDGEKIKMPELGLVYSGKHTIKITEHEEEYREEGRFS